MTELEYTVTSPGDLDLPAERLGKLLKAGDTVGLCGPLGAGKTTFTKHLALVLGSTDEVSSPTYVLEHEYRIREERVLEHWDLFRLTTPPEELLCHPPDNHIRVIEWIDKFDTIEADFLVTLSAPEDESPQKRHLRLCLPD